jgi:hypothetical protein
MLKFPALNLFSWQMFNLFASNLFIISVSPNLSICVGHGRVERRCVSKLGCVLLRLADLPLAARRLKAMGSVEAGCVVGRPHWLLEGVAHLI